MVVTMLEDDTSPIVPVDDIDDWHETVDVIVAGTGGSGMVAAVVAADRGARVLALEKAAHTGGTTRKSGGGVWVPDNHFMRELGLDDSRDGALHYMAATAWPERYDATAPSLGLPPIDHDLLCAFYDHGGRVFAELERMGALTMLPLPDYPNYYSTIPQDVHKFGRTMGPRDADGNAVEGPEMIAQLTAALEARGGRVAVEHRIVSAAVDGERVVGVVARTPAGDRSIRASQAVILATGGFTHDPALRNTYLEGPVYGGCAAVTNEGDIVSIVAALGAELHNMCEAWHVPIVLERALACDPTLRGAFNIVGDGVLCVNSAGERVMNEKCVYNEATRPMRAPGPDGDYPNQLLFAVWDQRNYDEFRGSPYDGGIMPATGLPDGHVLRGADLDELARALDSRLAEIAHATGDVRLAPDFAERLRATIDRFNALALKGHDDDFERGDTAIERHMHRLAVNAARMGTDSGMAAMVTPGVGWAVPVEPDDPNAPNPTMRPISDTGPYYATILAAGTLDTKGGPRVDRHGRVLRPDATPIPGLYAVGNCAGSPTGHAYWGAGGTLGPMITYAFLAGDHAARNGVSDQGL